MRIGVPTRTAPVAGLNCASGIRPERRDASLMVPLTTSVRSEEHYRSVLTDLSFPKPI